MEQTETSPATRPWNLDVLRQVPAFAWADVNPVRSLYYEGEPYQGRPTRVFAQYATPGTLSGDPAKDVNLPAIVLVHGGLGTAFPQWAQLWAERGYAAIAMDLSGVGPGRKRLPDGGPDQSDEVKFHTMDQPLTDQWTYHAVANVIRAHSLIRSFPEVDPENTATIGISWGGYLTCIVAGLDDRFKAAATVYGCGFLHENSAWLKEFDKMPAEHRAKWIQHWDPSHYVGAATMPMLFINGGKDFAYPPDSFAKTYALVRSAKNMHYVPDFPHGYYFDKPKALEVFVDQHLKGGVPLPMISAPKMESDQVAATVETATALMTAVLHYTADDLRGDANTRQWISRDAIIDGQLIRVEKPPEDATCWFLTVTDEREVTVSSKLGFPKPGPEQDLYLFSYFINEKGIHLAASEDGLHFEALNDGNPIMMPADWEGGGLTRDPSIVYHDGLFHMVWGIAHKGCSFAYAQSKDLVNWSEPLRVFPFGEVPPQLLWAPEITWDPLREELMVVFSWNHVPHVTRSSDGRQWSQGEKIPDLCTSCIDGFLALHETEAGPGWIMIYKDVNRVEDGGKNLRVARIAGDFSGGWTLDPEPIIGPGTAINAHAMTEGQSMIKRDGEWWLYWDSPQGGWTGLATSTNLVNWVDRTDQLVVPRPAYHGTFFRAPRKAIGWPLPEHKGHM